MAKSRLFNMFLLIVFILFISACDKNRTGWVQASNDLVSIAVTPDNPIIAVGAIQQFTATGTYSDNTTQDLTASVTWSSSDASVTFGSTPGLATSTIAVSDIIITATDSATSIHGTNTLTVTEAGLVLYYAPGATASDPSTCAGAGTITNPYIGFCTPSVSGTVAAYLAPGTYDLTAAPGGVTLPNNWNLYGRTANYSAPAPLANRPEFSGIINVAGGTVTFKSIAMTGNSPGSGILNISNTNAILQNVNIANTAIGAAGSAGMYAESSSTINFVSGTTNITGQTDSLFNIGIYLDSSTINFNGGTVSITGTGVGAANYGIYMNSSNAYFNGGSVNISASQGTYGYGIYASNSSNIYYANSLVSNSMTISSNATGVNNYGIYSNDGTSQLFIAGAEITNSSEAAALDNFISFISSSSGSGMAVSWNGITHPW